MLINHLYRFLSVFYLIFFLSGIKAISQNNFSASGNISAETIIYDGELPPLWAVALNEGRWHNYSGSQSVLYAGAILQWNNSRNLLIEAGIEGDHSSGYNETYLHTGTIKAAWKNWKLSAGKHTFDPIFIDKNQGSGSYLYGNNYRPIPRITLELTNFSPVPFTNGLLETRGGISQGWLKNQQYGGDVLLHEKYAYLRFNIKKWKPYIGLNHSAMMGGNRSDGSSIPIDFWATFFGEGSDKIGGGEATNAAGAHMGLYDFGTYLQTSKGQFHFYYQIPFGDGSGSLFWHGNTDHVLGIDWKPLNISWLKNLTFEWIQTTYQSGNGMPDPGLPGEMTESGYYLHYSKLSQQQIDQLIEENKELLTQDELNKTTWTSEEIKNLLKKVINHGNDFGGRDGYMNNGMYPSGWSYNGHIMGSPFNLTEQQIETAYPNINFQHPVKIKNDRFKALHLGAAGNIGTQIKWQTKISWTRNFGTYFEQYPGRYTWVEAENYWFKGGRDQWYTFLQWNWCPKKWKQANIHIAFAYDGGDIYQSTGLKAGFNFNF